MNRAKVICRRLQFGLFVLGGCLMAGWVPLRSPAQDNGLPALKIACSLTWDQPYEGDPLRVRVRLTCPQAGRVAALQLRLLEQGRLPGDPVPCPSIATHWEDGVQLALYRLDDQQKRVLVLGPDRWAPYLRPLVGEVPDFEGAPSVKSREWLVSDTAATLREGRYVLSVAWNGLGLTDSSLLPSDGLLRGQDLDFEVATSDDDEAQATHLGRLAFQHYIAGDPEGARLYGRQAIQLDPQSPARERIQTYFLVANASVRLNDYLGSANTLQDMVSALSDTPSNEATDLANERLNLLAPRLEVPTGSQNNLNQFRFQLLSLPSQRYVSYTSADLLHWMPFSTNLGTGNWIDVIDSNAAPSNVRFYRSVLTP